MPYLALSNYEQELRWNPKNVTPRSVFSPPYEERSPHINEILQKVETDGITMEIQWLLSFIYETCFFPYVNYQWPKNSSTYQVNFTFSGHILQFYYLLKILFLKMEISIPCTY